MAANNGAQGFSNALMPTDDRVQHKHWRWQSTTGENPIDLWAPGVLWSASRMMGGGAGWGGPFLDDFDGLRERAEVQIEQTGGQQAYVLVGTTRDSNGNSLANCIVMGYVTSTDQFVGQVTSDASGYFSLPTQYGAVNHYLVAYKAGSPDVAGTSSNQLVPVA
jgi:hypothetical protein